MSLAACVGSALAWEEGAEVRIYACPPSTRNPRDIECNTRRQLNFKELLIY